jgi:predicted nucleotide-binding protein
MIMNHEDTLAEIHQYLPDRKARALALPQQAVRDLEKEEVGMLTGVEGSAVPATELAPQPLTADKPVFVVHGRDDQAKIEIARVLERAGLNVMILHEQPNAGRTIIEKFEDHGGAAGFAVVVLTPDDVGGTDREHLPPRARQNVIAEMFWFAGRLGRHRVCSLLKGEIEIPSDFAGVGYTAMDDYGGWKAKLLGELNAAGYEVDWGKALA